jgi:hypothetical protein
LDCPPAPHASLPPPQIREFLEKAYVETSGRDTIKLAIRSLMETVEASSKNIEVAVMEAGGLRWVWGAGVASCCVWCAVCLRALLVSPW